MTKRHKEICGVGSIVGTVLCLDCSNGYMIECVCQNSKLCTKSLYLSLNKNFERI